MGRQGEPAQRIDGLDVSQPATKRGALLGRGRCGIPAVEVTRGKEGIIDRARDNCASSLLVAVVDLVLVFARLYPCFLARPAQWNTEYNDDSKSTVPDP